MNYKNHAKRSQEDKLHRMTGGRVEHSDEKEDKDLIKKEVKPSALKHRAAGGPVSMDGGMSKPRSDRPHRGGGKSKGKSKGGSHVNVLVNPKIGGGPDAGGDPGAMPPPPSGGPSPIGAGAPPMPPPGAGPMQPPMRRGGRVKRASGGKVHMDAGAGSGEGRLEKIGKH